MARYHVIVESPLGERGGTLILYERGGAVAAGGEQPRDR